jgi:hypothetical protein
MHEDEDGGGRQGDGKRDRRNGPRLVIGKGGDEDQEHNRGDQAKARQDKANVSSPVTTKNSGRIRRTIRR